MTPTEDLQGAQAPQPPRPQQQPSRQPGGLTSSPPCRMPAQEGAAPLPTPSLSDGSQSQKEEEKEVEEEEKTAREPRDGGVRTLLQFVTVAGGDIKAALDRSAPCKRSVDHRKYLQRQLKRYTGFVPAEEENLEAVPHGELGPVPHRDTTAATTCHSKSVGHKCAASAELHQSAAATGIGGTPVKAQPKSPVKTVIGVSEDNPAVSDKLMSCNTGHLDLAVDISPSRQMYKVGDPHCDRTMVGVDAHGHCYKAADHQMDRTPIDGRTSCDDRTPASLATSAHNGPLLTSNHVLRHDFDSDPLFEQVIARCAGHKGLPSIEHKSRSEGADGMTPAGQGGKEPSVPLRHRRLPASFWKEPDVPKHVEASPLSAYQKYGSMLLSCGLYKDLMGSHRTAYNGAGLHSHYPSASQLAAVGLQGAYESSLYHSLAMAKYSPSDLSTLGQYPSRWPSSANHQLSSICDKSAAAALTPSMAVFESRLQSLASQDVYHRNAGGHCAPNSSPYSPSTVHRILDPVNSQSELGIGPLGSSGSHRSPVWRPIPTKSMTVYPSRYHPFADVH